MFAQVDPVGMYNRYVVENWSGNYHRIGQYKVKGSPFLMGEPIPGQLKYQGGAFTKNDKIMYNIYTQKVGPEVDGGIFETDQVIEEFTLIFPAKYGGGTAIFKNGSKYSTAKNVHPYFGVLSEGGPVQFLAAFKVRLVMDPSNMMDKELRLFEQYKEYYVYDVQHAVLTKVKLNKKDIIAALKASPELQKLANEYEGDVSSEASAIQMVQSLN